MPSTRLVNLPEMANSPEVFLGLTNIARKQVAKAELKDAGEMNELLVGHDRSPRFDIVDYVPRDLTALNLQTGGQHVLCQRPFISQSAKYRSDQIGVSTSTSRIRQDQTSAVAIGLTKGVPA